MMSLRALVTALLTLATTLVLAACGGEDGGASAEDRALARVLAQGPLMPLEEGTRWTWRVNRGGAAWEVEARKFGGDARPRDGRTVDYEFIYGDVGEVQDGAKSILPNPPEGLEEFYLDGFYASVQHDPPLPLLPSEPRVGAQWSWTGALKIKLDDATTRELTTTLVLTGLETIVTPAGTFEAVRTDETADGLRIIRWFAPGTGLVRYEVLGREDGKPKQLFTMQLAAFTPAGSGGD